MMWDKHPEQPKAAEQPKAPKAMDDLKARIAKAQGAYLSEVALIDKQLHSRAAGHPKLMAEAAELQKSCDVQCKLEPIKLLAQPEDKSKHKKDDK
jgi:hypothetical protein